MTTGPSVPAAGPPLVTVAMPVLDEEAQVAASIASVLEQTLGDLELLVVDGGSTDGTLDRVRPLAARDPRVRVLENPHRTIPRALNIALGQARGRYLARVDGHGTIEATYLARAVTALDADPRLGAVGGLRVGVARTAAGVAVATALSSRFGVGDSINHYARTAQETDHASFGVVRIEVLHRLGGWDEQLLANEDVDLDFRIMGLGYRIRFDPLMRIDWHVRESLADFARQYRRYGRGKAAMVRKNGIAAVRPRHLAPLLLLGAVGAALVAAVLHRWAVTGGLVGAYAVAVVVATALARRGEPVRAPAGDHPGGPPAPARRPSPLLLAASFVVMHLSWGLGFVEGMMLRRHPAPGSGPPPLARSGAARPPAASSGAAGPADRGRPTRR